MRLNVASLRPAGQGGAARRVRAPGAHVVRRLGAAPPVPAAVRSAASAARRVCGDGRRLRRGPARLARAGAALRRRAPAGAPPVSRRAIRWSRASAGWRECRRRAPWPTGSGSSRQETLAPLVQLNHDLVTDAIARLQLPRLTIDVDGTVVRTGGDRRLGLPRVQSASSEGPQLLPPARACGPDGHILRLKNRPGNVHDSKQAAAFLREVIDGLRGRFGRRLPLEFRMDAAFFQRDVLRLLAGARLPLRDQGRLLELAAAQATRGRARALAARRSRASPASTTTWTSRSGTCGSA